MRLYLMRHGEAATPDSQFADRDRPLTPSGMEKIRRQARFAALAGWRVDRIACSPYVRARQTADLMAEALPATVTVCSELTPDCRLPDLVEVMAGLAPMNRVLIVGHQPAMGALVAVLSGCRVAMAPGAVAVLDVTRLRPEGAMLAGFYDPMTMAALGG